LIPAAVLLQATGGVCGWRVNRQWSTYLMLAAASVAAV
jgi:hypothetical protein